MAMRRITELLIVPTAPPSRKLWTRDEFYFIARETNFFSSFLRLCAQDAFRLVARFGKNEKATKKQHREGAEGETGVCRMNKIFLARKFREFVAAGCREFFAEIYGSSTKSLSDLAKDEI